MQEFDYNETPPPPSELDTLVRILGASHEDVVWAVRVGSQVYGTAQESSDHDYMVALAKGKDTLVKGEGIDIVVKSLQSFEDALDEHNIFALECYFAPIRASLKKTRVKRLKVNTGALLASANEKSLADYNKGLREPMDYGCKKRLWHSLRVADFAFQIWRKGFLDDYTSANEMYWDLMTDPSEDPAHYRNRWGPVRERLLSRLSG